jgi:hypothetical protein
VTEKLLPQAVFATHFRPFEAVYTVTLPGAHRFLVEAGPKIAQIGLRDKWGIGTVKIAKNRHRPRTRAIPDLDQKQVIFYTNCTVLGYIMGPYIGLL